MNKIFLAFALLMTGALLSILAVNVFVNASPSSNTTTSPIQTEQPSPDVNGY